MNLSGLKSIHINTTEIGDAAAQEPAQPYDGRFEKVNRSPAEEFAAKAAQSEMERLPDALAAVIMHETRREQVTADGIVFKFNGTTYKFWHAESSTCHPQNLGKYFYVAFDRDVLDVVYVLSEDGAYIETLPQKNKIAWFDPSMDAEIASNRRVLNHVHQIVARAQSDRTEQIHQRTKSNAEKVQHLHSFPAPTTPAETPVEGTHERISEASRASGGDSFASRNVSPVSGERPSVPDADAATIPSGSIPSRASSLAKAGQRMAGQRKRQASKQARISNERGTLDALEPRQPVRRRDEYAENADMDKF